MPLGVALWCHTSFLYTSFPLVQWCSVAASLFCIGVCVLGVLLAGGWVAGYFSRLPLFVMCIVMYIVLCIVIASYRFSYRFSYLLV